MFVNFRSCHSSFFCRKSSNKFPEFLIGFSESIPKSFLFKIFLERMLQRFLKNSFSISLKKIFSICYLISGRTYEKIPGGISNRIQLGSLKTSKEIYLIKLQEKCLEENPRRNFCRRISQKKSRCNPCEHCKKTFKMNF